MSTEAAVIGYRSQEALMRAVGEAVKLRVAWGDAPRAGDGLQMPSGRRYLVRKVRGKTLHCTVLPPLPELVELPAGGRWVPWEWASRRARARLVR